MSDGHESKIEDKVSLCIVWSNNANCVKLCVIWFNISSKYKPFTCALNNTIESCIIYVSSIVLCCYILILLFY